MKIDEISVEEFEAEVAAVLEAIGDEIEKMKRDGQETLATLSNVNIIWEKATKGEFKGKEPRGWWRRTARRIK